MRSILKYQLPPVVWILVTVTAAHFPEFPFEIKLHPGTEKIVHAGVYFVLCGLVRRAFYHQELSAPLKSRSLLGAFIFCCTYAILDEFHQNLLPGRSSDIYNFIAAAGGALLYCAIVSLVSQQKNRGGHRSEG